MRDRYYIFLIITAIGVLTGWLFAYDAVNQADVVAYNGRFAVPQTVTAQAEARLVTAAAKERVLGSRAEAATSTGNQESARLPVSDPIRMAGAKDFKTSASSALVMNEQTGHVLWQENGNEPRSIASITKLFTALVFLDFNPGWDKTYQVRSADRREGGKIYLWSGEKVKVKDLFYLSLVASGNSETIALINATGLGEELFVKKMNEKAKALGLAQTVFKDPVGLNESNVSTALEVAKFAREALSRPEILQVVKTERFKVRTQAGRERLVESTDELLGDTDRSGVMLLGGKTGYNNRAGYCFVGKFNNQDNQPLISVVLGEATKKSRFTETMELIDWAYDNYAWPQAIK